MTVFAHQISVAPMIRRTDRHCRFLHRLISPNVLLYTEMITAEALCHGDAKHLLRHDVSEHPVVIQLGGSNPKALAQAAKMAEEAGYDAVNLNVGCPSDRVKSGQFGVCLMREPALVAACFDAMQSAVAVPVGVKTRIGVDHDDSESFFFDFIDAVHRAGCKHWIIHARKAWLNGLSPKANRNVPPLNYQRVYDLKQRYPDCFVEINGGILDAASALMHLAHVDAVMLGRAVYQNPWLLHEIDLALQCESGPSSREDLVEAYLPYVSEQLAAGVKLSAITPHMMGLFHHQPKGRLWRRHLTAYGSGCEAGVATIRDALQLLA